MKKGRGVRVLILRTAGTNCDQETALAFEQCGAGADLMHINRLFDGDVSLGDYHILALPGGFTYGDDIISGRILANELRLRLGSQIEGFVRDGKLIIGICNGFQVLVRSGFLPGDSDSGGPAQTVTLTYNDSGKFEDRWTHLRLSGRSVWTEGLEEVVYLPVAHAEGKFSPSSKALLNEMKQNGQIVFRYCDPAGDPADYPANPNGSVFDVAGITDRTGRILGMMPHPERHFLFEHHPFWTRREQSGQYGHGAGIFFNGVNYVKKNLL